MLSRLTLLIALLAQVLALLSPVCLERCVGSGGHECLVVIGQECPHHQHSLGQPGDVCDEQESVPAIHNGDDDEDDCQHVPLESVPLLKADSMTAERSAATSIFDPIPVSSWSPCFVFNELAAPSDWLMRWRVPVHLTALATVVLRA